MLVSPTAGVCVFFSRGRSIRSKLGRYRPRKRAAIQRGLAPVTICFSGFFLSLRRVNAGVIDPDASFSSPEEDAVAMGRRCLGAALPDITS